MDKREALILELKKFKDGLSTYIPIKKMILFGSQAKGKTHRWSDVDLLIVSDKFKRKKSQIYSQIFIYILALVLTSVVLIYGYNAVQNFNKRANQVCFLKFRNDLSNAIESITSDYGSVKRKDLQLCANYKQVCFVESFERISNRDNPQGTSDPIIKDSIKSETGKNVFLVERIAKESFYAGNVSVKKTPTDPDVLCIDAKNNQISLRLEGMGNHVRVSEWGRETTLAESAPRGTAEGISITALPTANLDNLRGQ